MRRLGLIVGGVQKAGTSSLFHYLRQHPQLRAPVRKELHVFDDPRAAIDPHAAVMRNFGPTDDADRRLPFDVTPIYLFWPGALAAIGDYNPDVRLIFLFRDPIERAWSHWRMSVANGSETLGFGTAIREGRARLLDPGDDRARRRFSYVERGLYGSQVARLLSLFDRAKLLFLRARDLAERRDATLARIADWLGLGPFPPIVEQRALWAPADTGPLPADVAYLRTLFRDETARFADLTGLEVGDWTSVNREAPLWRPRPPAQETTAPSGQRQSVPSLTASRLPEVPSAT